MIYCFSWVIYKKIGHTFRKKNHEQHKPKPHKILQLQIGMKFALVPKIEYLKYIVTVCNI